MRELLTAIKSVIKKHGFVYENQAATNKAERNKYSIRVTTTPSKNNTLGTMGSLRLEVEREIRIILEYRATNNPGHEIIIIEKQDAILADLYNYENLVFLSAEILQDMSTDGYFNEIRFAYQNYITLS